MALKLSALFKRSKSGSEPAKATSRTEIRPTVKETSQTQPVTPTRTTIDQSARHQSGKRSAPKKSVEEKVPKKAPETKRAATTSRTVPVEKPVKKETVPKKAVSEPKTPVKRSPAKSAATGKRSLEMIELDKRLEDFAKHIRVKYDPRSADAVFTEYMARAFREMGYKMVLIRDLDIGLITMLDRPKDEHDDSLKDKIVVRCIYLREGSVTPEVIISVQEEGAFYHADETWCITPAEFSEAAKRRARKEGAKVKLFDGRKLFKEFLSRYL